MECYATQHNATHWKHLLRTLLLANSTNRSFSTTHNLRNYKHSTVMSRYTGRTTLAKRLQQDGTENNTRSTQKGQVGPILRGKLGKFRTVVRRSRTSSQQSPAARTGGTNKWAERVLKGGSQPASQVGLASEGGHPGTRGRKSGTGRPEAEAAAPKTRRYQQRPAAIPLPGRALPERNETEPSMDLFTDRRRTEPSSSPSSASAVVPLNATRSGGGGDDDDDNSNSPNDRIRRHHPKTDPSTSTFRLPLPRNGVRFRIEVLGAGKRGRNDWASRIEHEHEHEHERHR
eukprot:jgi/Psemu1/67470/estExt_Genemark1.C_3240019